MHRRGTFWGVLVLMSCSMLEAQKSEDRYYAIKEALGLSDSQIAQSQKEGPDKAPQILSESQREKLWDIARRLHRSEAEGALANWLGLNKELGWRLCECYCPMHIYASQLGFTDAQNERLWTLRQAMLPEAMRADQDDLRKRYLELLKSGVKTPPGMATPRQNLDLLLWYPPPRLSREAALGILNDSQRALVAELESALKVAREAVELGLLLHEPLGEPACH